jgi:hypothetical protein
MRAHGGPSGSEPCDFCGCATADDSQVFAVVHDSSFVSTVDPALDGSRLVCACGTEHLIELERSYADRPFVEPELWAAKIRRAVRVTSQHHLDPLADRHWVATMTGLTAEQIGAAMDWLAAQ